MVEHEAPFTVGSATMMNISAESLLLMCDEESVDVLIVSDSDLRLMDEARARVKPGGMVVTMRQRKRSVAASVETVPRRSSAEVRVQSLRKRKKNQSVRSLDDQAPPRTDDLAELLGVVPSGARVVALTSCGGSLLAVSQEREFRTVCTESGRSEFHCSVANYGALKDYQKH